MLFLLGSSGGFVPESFWVWLHPASSSHVYNLLINKLIFINYYLCAADSPAWPGLLLFRGIRVKGDGYIWFHRFLCAEKLFLLLGLSDKILWSFMVSSRKFKEPLPWKRVNESIVQVTQAVWTRFRFLRAGPVLDQSRPVRVPEPELLSSAPGVVSLSDSFVNFYVQSASFRAALQVTPGVKGHNAKALFIPFHLDSADSSEFNLRRFCWLCAT